MPSDEGRLLCQSLCDAFSTCLEKSEEDPEKDVCVCVETCDAAKKVVPLYDKIFGEGTVSNALKRDLDGSAVGCKTVSLSNPIEWRTMDDLIKGEVAKRGLQVVRKDKASGVVKLLWMKRALRFIALFLQNAILDMPDAPVKDAASAAYTKVLRPYHGALVSTIVSAAFRLAPGRDKLLKALGFDSMGDAVTALEQFLSVITPVLDSIDNSLKEHECDFSDKA